MEMFENSQTKSSKVENNKVQYNMHIIKSCSMNVVLYNSMTACDNKKYGDRPVNIGQLAHQ